MAADLLKNLLRKLPKSRKRQCEEARQQMYDGLAQLSDIVERKTQYNGNKTPRNPNIRAVGK